MLVPPGVLEGSATEQSLFAVIQRWDSEEKADKPGRIEVVPAATLLEWGRRTLRPQVSFFFGDLMHCV